MGLAGRLAKKAASKAGTAAKNKVVRTVNGGCPGAANGKHSYKTKLVGKTKTAPGSPVTWCHNKGCGRVA